MTRAIAQNWNFEEKNKTKMIFVIIRKIEKGSLQ